MLFSARFLLTFVIIVASHSRSDQHSSSRVRSACFPHTVWLATPRWRRGDTGTVRPRTSLLELAEIGGVTFMVKHCFISPTTSHSCELEPTMIRSSTCTAMNTLRTRSTKSVGCAAGRAKPSRDVSTSAKCSWKSRDASFKPFETLSRHRTVPLRSERSSCGSAYTRSPSRMGEFMKATVISPHKKERSHHRTRSHLFGSLSSVTPACGPDFASHLSSRNCLIHGKTFHQVEFTIHADNHFLGGKVFQCVLLQRETISDN